MPYASLDQIAHLLKLTPRTINHHAKNNGLPRISRGEYDMVQVIHWYIEYLKQQIQDARRGTESEQQAHTRLTVASADLKELELARERGKLIEIGLTQIAWERLVISFKTRLLSLPSKLPQRLIACKDIKQIKELLHLEIEEALSELSRTDIDAQELKRVAETHSEYSATGNSPAKTHRKRVGRQKPRAKPGVKRGTGPVENGQGGVPEGNDGRVD